MLLKCDQGHLHIPATLREGSICRYEIKHNYFWIGNKRYEEVKLSDGNWKICKNEYMCWEWPAEVELINQ